MLPWTELQCKELSKKELREQYLAVQSVIIQAFGRLGNYFYSNQNLNMQNILVDLQKINWKRSADVWFLRVVKENGRMINNEKAIILATNMIKKSLDLILSDSELKAEEELLNNLKNRG